MTNETAPFPESGNGWALFQIPTDLAAPDSDGIPTYGITPKEPTS